MANIDRSSSEHGELPRRWSSGSLNQSQNRMAKRVALLERDSARIVDRARGAGVPITYLGAASLFREPQAYAGAETDWVIAPVFDHSEAVVPRAERRALQRLVDAGIDFPLVYMAYEIPKDRLTLAPAAYGQPSAAVNLDRATAAHVVGTPPPPVAATELANRLRRQGPLRQLAVSGRAGAGLRPRPGGDRPLGGLPLPLRTRRVLLHPWHRRRSLMRKAAWRADRRNQEAGHAHRDFRRHQLA